MQQHYRLFRRHSIRIGTVVVILMESLLSSRKMVSSKGGMDWVPSHCDTCNLAEFRGVIKSVLNGPDGPDRSSYSNEETPASRSAPAGEEHTERVLKSWCLVSFLCPLPLLICNVMDQFNLNTFLKKTTFQGSSEMKANWL